MTDILVRYSSRGTTRQIAERTTVSAPIGFGRQRRTLADHIRTKRRELAEMATAYVTVGASTPRAVSAFATAEERFFDDIAWKPGPVSELASALRGRAYAWMRTMLGLDAAPPVGSLAERSGEGRESFFGSSPQDPNG